MKLDPAKTKLASCHAGCGAMVEVRTNPKVCCESCRLEKARARARRTSESALRARGVPRQKGQPADCISCGAQYTKANHRAKRCEPCRVAACRARARLESARKVAEGDNEYRNRWAKEKRRKDPAYGIASSMRTMISRGLAGGKGGRSWTTLVPYTLADLMKHLERQFLPGMTWANRGPVWHVDHVVPLSSFKFESAQDPEFQAAWALSNLRPLWALDNMQKHATRLHLL